VDIDVTGALRLQFVTTDSTPPACLICGPGGGPFVWGDARLTG
jgi:hypothetical protein